EYANVRSVKWYNEHSSCDGSGSLFDQSPGNRCESGDDYEDGKQTTGLYYEWIDSESMLAMYLEAPLSSKNMLWTDGSDSGLVDEIEEMYGEGGLDFYKMTRSEYLEAFNGDGDTILTANLAKDGFWDSQNAGSSPGDGSGTVFVPDDDDYGNVTTSLSSVTIEDYADSVSYVTSVDREVGLRCTEAKCERRDVPMGYEFKFSGFSDRDSAVAYAMSITDVEYHLSPQGFGDGPICNGPDCNPSPPPSAVPEPSVLALMAMGLFVGRRRLLQRRS
ncbi:MAG: PEP-CTERM sorting domain-containing protein, partial [Chromatocurvus sp.]